MRMPAVAQVSKLLTTPSAVNAMFAEGIYTEGDTRVAKLLQAMPVAVEADAVAAQLKKARVFQLLVWQSHHT